MYGENTGLLRAELTTLLRQHRIQQRLGGKGLHTLPETTTVDQREKLGQQVARYRHAVLVWCLQALRAANPRINLEGAFGRTRGPAGDLRYRLTAAVEASSEGLPLLDELTTPQEFQLVESWRLAARAAALGEHDFGAGVGYGHLSENQCMTVLKDAAEITRGLVGLDRRYEGIPGWEKLKDQGRLGRAAEVCAAFAGYDEPDYSVDLRGWRPPPVIDRRPALPRLAGIHQGEYNLLVHLKHFPDAHSLRLVLDSQRIVSHEASTRVRNALPAFADRWAARAEIYTTLIHETRNVRGLLGNGGRAAARAAIVAARAQRLACDEVLDARPFRQLDRLFTMIDARLTEAIEHGVSERLYFLRVKLPRVVDQADGLVQPLRTRYVPINYPVQTDLLRIVRTQLRPPPERPRAPKGAGRSRAEFEAAITHCPSPRGVTPDGPSL
jgi:hypothetical protein